MSESVPSDGGSEDPATRRLRDELWTRLGERRLSSRWFYDRRGSELFEAITRLPEYYLTRTERSLLESGAREWMRRLQPGALVELGAGSARKTRVLLDALQEVRPGAVYVPLDVSADFLASTAEALRREYPALRIEPEVGDLTRPLEIDRHGEPPTLFALLGSTLGNFPPPAAVSVLGHVRRAMSASDTFLLGVDLRPGATKSVAELEAAYDDHEGVTADFNRNMLRVLNRRAGTDFEPGAWEHRAFYDADAGRIEMHLVAPGGARVRVPGRGAVTLEPGASLRTEISCKYDRPTVDALFREAGLERRRWIADERERYAMVFARRAR